MIRRACLFNRSIAAPAPPRLQARDAAVDLGPGLTVPGRNLPVEADAGVKGAPAAESRPAATTSTTPGFGQDIRRGRIDLAPGVATECSGAFGSPPKRPPPTSKPARSDERAAAEQARAAAGGVTAMLHVLRP
jgi:hypothetical protein